MGWKNWPSWVKGGIILESIIILIFLIYYFIWMPIFSDNILILFLLIPGLLLSLPFANECFTFMSPSGNCPISQGTYGVIIIILSLIAYFIIGAIIGGIVGKIKSRGKK